MSLADWKSSMSRRPSLPSNRDVMQGSCELQGGPCLQGSILASGQAWNESWRLTAGLPLARPPAHSDSHLELGLAQRVGGAQRDVGVGDGVEGTHHLRGDTEPWIRKGYRVLTAVLLPHLKRSARPFPCAHVTMGPSPCTTNATPLVASPCYVISGSLFEATHTSVAWSVAPPTVPRLPGPVCNLISGSPLLQAAHPGDLVGDTSPPTHCAQVTWSVHSSPSPLLPSQWPLLSAQPTTPSPPPVSDLPGRWVPP